MTMPKTFVLKIGGRYITECGGFTKKIERANVFTGDSVVYNAEEINRQVRYLGTDLRKPLECIEVQVSSVRVVKRVLIRDGETREQKLSREKAEFQELLAKDRAAKIAKLS